MSLLAQIERLPFDDIVRFEVRRHGAIVGLDPEEVLQEVRTLVHVGCVPKLDGTNQGRSYVRRSVRNALATLHRQATTAGRQPRDARGRGVGWVPYEDSASPNPTPEALASAAQLRRMLKKIPKRDREVLASAFLDGVRRTTASEVEAARARAEAILSRLLTGGHETMKKTPTGTEGVPDCHAEGTDPIGYETDINEAAQCQNCTDKFTCLPAGIKSGLIKGVDLSIDPEVLAGYRGIVTVNALRERLAARTKAIDAGKLVPEKLAYDNIPGVMETLAKADPNVQKAGPAKPDDDDDEENEDDNQEQKTMSTKKKSKQPVKADKAPKTKAEKPKAKAKAEKPPKKKRGDGGAPANRLGEKGSFKYEGKPKKQDDGSIKLPNGRTIPAPKEITAEKMETALSRLNGKLGLDFDLTVGMTLKQTRRNDEPIVIKITKTGFVYDGETYASLSGACMAATERSVSGVEMFNFDKHNNIEVSGKGVPGGSFSKAKAEAVEPAPKKAKAKPEKAKAKPEKASKKKGKKKPAPAPEPDEADEDEAEDEGAIEGDE